MVRSDYRILSWLTIDGAGWRSQNGLEAVEFCATHEVDVVLMDMLMR